MCNWGEGEAAREPESLQARAECIEYLINRNEFEDGQLDSATALPNPGPAPTVLETSPIPAPGVLILLADGSDDCLYAIPVPVLGFTGPVGVSPSFDVANIGDEGGKGDEVRGDLGCNVDGRDPYARWPTPPMRLGVASVLERWRSCKFRLYPRIAPEDGAG